MEDEELIRQQMEETRESLTEKLDALENTVADSVSAVSETVSHVKESFQEGAEVVKDTVHEGVESVKDMFDVPTHFRAHPWMALGGAIACGYLLGTLAAKPAVARPTAFPPLPPAPPAPRHQNGKHKETKQAASSAAEGLLSAIKPEIDMLKGLALGATFGTFREMIAREAPPKMGEQIRTIIDGVTRKLGGEPMPSSDFPDSPHESDPVGIGESRW